MTSFPAFPATSSTTFPAFPATFSATLDDEARVAVSAVDVAPFAAVDAAPLPVPFSFIILFNSS